MLAAMNEKDNALELIKLALSLISSGNVDIPDSLVEHLRHVFEQAKELAIEPHRLQGSDKPFLSESIDLAVELKNDETFSKEVEQVTDYNNISPDLAHRLLMAMENYSVYKE